VKKIISKITKNLLEHVFQRPWLELADVPQLTCVNTDVIRNLLFIYFKLKYKMLMQRAGVVKQQAGPEDETEHNG